MKCMINEEEIVPTVTFKKGELVQSLSTNVVILCTGGGTKSDDRFSGTIISSPTTSYIGTVSNSWLKNSFVLFTKSMLIHN